MPSMIIPAKKSSTSGRYWERSSGSRSLRLSKGTSRECIGFPYAYLCVRACVCVCVCVCVCLSVCLSVCVCVCERERERERESLCVCMHNVLTHMQSMCAHVRLSVHFHGEKSRTFEGECSA